VEIDDTGTVNRQVDLAVKENEKLFEQKHVKFGSVLRKIAGSVWF